MNTFTSVLGTRLAILASTAAAWRRSLTARVPMLALGRDVAKAADRQNLAMAAGGLAFFALLSGAPLLIAFVSIYGLVATPAKVDAQVGNLAEILPEEARALVHEQLDGLVRLSVTQLEIGAIASIVGGLWAGSKGTFYLFRALNLAYGVAESRGILKVKAMAFAFTLLLIVAAAVVLGFVGWLPTMLGLVGLEAQAASLFDVLRWPAVAALASIVLALIYRFGPDRRNRSHRWVSVGSVAAVLTWLALSFLFSRYVAHFGEFNRVYGSLAAVVILLLWLYLGAFLILLGAVVDAQLAELRRTPARPSRKAYGSGHSGNGHVETTMRR